MNNRYPRLSRTMLFAPASRPDMMAKAAHSQADVICLDLEDAVAPEQKEASRAHIIQALQELDFGGRGRMVRINALDTHLAYRDVIEVVEAAGAFIDLLMLPKVQDARDVHFLDTLLTQIETAKGLTTPIGLEVQIETARGFMWLREIASSSPRLEALIFGPGDYAASMQMPLANIGAADTHDTAYPGHRWHAVMHGIVAAARANGLRCMDGPYADFKNEAGLEQATRTAVALGFDGKQCIHPAQLPTVNRLFAPSAAELAWAQAVAAAYQHALAEGRGAINLQGKMIDAANLRLAQTLLQRQQAITARSQRESGNPTPLDPIAP
ncbi:MAG: CoA ester lyase [Chloroflexi bacterium]|nr:CoA ester lyase [Chloroflexota bacterium]MBP8059859.1 CoA ester lyase [Chloroflexota bacterium]